nr:cobalt-precorrin-5B (C(1))-methyltransferase [Candidatus Methanomethylophilus sp. 1R26]
MEPIGEDQAFVYVEGRKLRRGYTTGTSAAAAAGAAARLLLTGDAPPYMRISTPKGIDVTVEVVSAETAPGCARASVRKDGGDDADDTNGAEICAESPASRRVSRSTVERGSGVSPAGGLTSPRGTRPSIMCRGR